MVEILILLSVLFYFYSMSLESLEYQIVLVSESFYLPPLLMILSDTDLIRLYKNIKQKLIGTPHNHPKNLMSSGHYFYPHILLPI